MMLAIFPELLSKGGIQRFSQQVCAVLKEIADGLNEPCHLLSLNDPKGTHKVEVAGRTFVVRGFGHSRAHFVFALLPLSFKSRFLYVGHPHFAPVGLLCKILNPKLRYIVSAFGLEVWHRLPLQRRLGLGHASAITSISEFTAQKMIDIQGVSSSRIRVIPCVIAENLLAANAKDIPPPSGDSRQRKTLLTVGRLDGRERQKGLDEVIQALPQLAQETVFVIAGDGDDRSRLERLAQERGLTDRVIFTGVVSDAELVALYRSCDVFLMPSRQEGFGIVFLEAMAFEKPVIGGNYGGTPEVILNNETGFLVEYGDVGALVDRIKVLLGNPELCKQMGEAGRRRVEQYYTFEPLRKNLIGLFAQLQTP
jgi:phosphatidyl-myo-inositol dimannoside synthase